MNALLRFGESLFPRLLDTVWQATVLLIIALLLARVLGRRHRMAGYFLQLLCLMGLVFLPIISLLYKEHRISIVPESVSARLTVERSSLEGPGQAEVDRPLLAESPPASPRSIRTTPSIAPGETSEGIGVGRESTTGLENEASPESPGAAAQRGQDEKSATAGLAFSWQALVGLIWIGGCTIHLLLLLFSVASAVRVRRLSFPPFNPALTELFEKAKRATGAAAKIELRLVKRFSFPFSVGILRPKILLPESLAHEMPPEQLRPVLLHELGHIRCNDYAVNILQRLAEAVLFFHPLVYLLNRRLRVLREEICDDWVLGQFTDANAYAKVLATVAERWLVPKKKLIGVGLFHHWDPLSKRIERILSSTGRLPTRLHVRTFLLLLLVSLVSVGALSRTSVSARYRQGDENDGVQAQNEDVPNNKSDVSEQEGFHPGAAEAPVANPELGVSLRLVRKGGDGYIALSPDGKYLCDYDMGRLVVCNLVTGSESTFVEERSDGIVEPTRFAISPDNKTVAYVWWNSKEKRYELHGIALDGTGHRMLHSFDESAQFRSDAWSPDGNRILGTIWGKSEGTQLVWVSVDDGSLHRIKKLDDWPERVELSPDGRHIAYDLPQADDNTEKRDIYMLGVDEAVQIPLIRHPANDKLLAWTPDGKNLFFESDRMGSWDGWLQRVDDGKPRGTPTLVRPNIGEVSPIGFTPTGSYFYGVEHAMLDVYTARLDSATGKVVARPEPLRQTGKDDWPDWSPDGKYLAYRSHLPRWRAAIHIRSLETGEDRVLDGEVPLLGFLRWSPDGKSVLAGGQMTVGDIVYLIDIESSSRRVLLRTEKERIGRPELSPDGKTLFYRLARRKLVARDLETETEREVFGVEHPGVMLWSHALSPDGKQLALVVSDRGAGSILQLVAVAGGETREIFRVRQGEYLGGVTWVPDGKNLLFTTNQKLWRISVEGGEPQELWEYEGSMYALHVHPDGQRIAFGKRDDTREVWIMENFLPTESPTPEPAPTMTLRRVVKECGGYTSVSPDGKYMCDSDDTAGNLVVRDLATGRQWPLTKEGSWELWRYGSSSAISPDNEQVAYLWCTNRDGVHDLRLARIDGSGERVLRRGEWIEPIEWSADGKDILGISGGPQVVWISAADGSTTRVIKPKAQPGGNVDLSPRGNYVAYTSKQKGSWDIYSLDLAGDRELPLVQHPANDRLLGWTPDGNHILFVSDRRGSWDAWLLRIRDGKPDGIPELVRTQLGDVSPVRLTRDGACYFGLKNETRQVYVAKLDLETGEVLSSPALVRQAGPDENPDWSPDGQYLAYTARQPDESKAIRIQSIETGEERQLDGKFPSFRWLRWCPDGRSLLVTGFLWENRDIIYRVDAETGERSVVLRRDGERIAAAELSRDGKTLVYGRDASRPPEGSNFAGELVARDLETGRERVFLEGHFFPPNQARTFALSPDDKQIAVFFYGWERRGLRIISVETGDSREILPIKSDQSIRGISWMPDEKDLILARGHGLWRISVEGGEPKRLWEWEYPLWCLKLHPDGQRIAFGMWWQPIELWVMENFLPSEEVPVGSK